MPPDEPRRSPWRSTMWDEFDPERDPALRRTRETLAKADAERAERLTEPPRAAGRVEVAPIVTPQPQVAPVALSRREKVSRLVARVQAGDLSAVAALRDLLGG